MKKIIVTGASGVVGSALLEKASSETEMLALTRRIPDAADVNESPHVVWAQTDYSKQSLRTLFAGADAVVHLAGIKGGITDIDAFEEDLNMMESVLEASLSCGIRKVIYSSSRLVYGNPDTIPWTEELIPQPQSAYSINKVRCEEMCRRYCENAGMDITVLRIAQVLSERDHMRNMVNVFRDLASEGKQLTVIGKSKAKRQYIYSRDVADIIMKMIDADVKGCTVVNAGMEKAYSNLEIAQAFNRAYCSSEPINYDDSKPETITSSVMDVHRMIGITGIIPRDIDQVLADMALRSENTAGC